MVSKKSRASNVLKVYIMRQRNPKVSARLLSIRLNVSVPTIFRYLRLIKEIEKEMTPIEEIISQSPTN